MMLTYDPNVNVAYLRLRERQGDVETVEVSADVMIDVDKTGAVCGIELLDVNAPLAAMDGGKLVLENARGDRAELDVA